MNPVLKKLQFKGQSPVLLLDAPVEFRETAMDLGTEVHSAAKGEYAFVLVFVKSLAEAKSAARTVKKALAPGGVFWLAYPKGTSKKYPGVDVNRDTAHEALGKLGFDGVSIVALDNDWSAMRYKRLE